MNSPISLLPSLHDLRFPVGPSTQTSDAPRPSCSTSGDVAGQTVTGASGRWTPIPFGAEKNARDGSSGLRFSYPKGRLPRTGHRSQHPGLRAPDQAGGRSTPGPRSAGQRPQGAPGSRQRLRQFRKTPGTPPRGRTGARGGMPGVVPKSKLDKVGAKTKWEEQS